MSDDGEDAPIAWTVGLLDLPSELQIEIFLTLFNQQSVVALSLTCHKLQDVYQRVANMVHVDQRSRIIEPIRNYVQFLDRFKLPNGRVRNPPPGGWPHIKPTPDNGLGTKTAFTIDILRHLPYIHNPEPHAWDYDGCFAHRSSMVDYSESSHHQGTQEELWLENFWYEGEEHPSGEPHILTLADGWEGPGHCFYIDTWTGLIFEEEEEFGPWSPIILAHDFFEDRIKSLTRFDEIFVPGEHTIFRRREHYDREKPWEHGHFWSWQERYVEYDPDDDPYDAEAMEMQGEYDGTDEEFGCMEDADWIRHLYFKHGWPGDNWDKEACLQAIREFVERRHERSGRF